MVPSDKSPEMNADLDRISMEYFGRKRSECINNDICLVCGKPAFVFRDDSSRTEFSITGYCQECQDSLFEDLNNDFEDDDIYDTCCGCEGCDGCNDLEYGEDEDFPEEN